MINQESVEDSMKTERELKKSREACINQVIRFSDNLNKIATNAKQKFTNDRMTDMRDLAESIVQATHEYSAYHNALLKPSNKSNNEVK